VLAIAAIRLAFVRVEVLFFVTIFFFVFFARVLKFGPEDYWRALSNF
jgi:hypothetical protein